MAGTLVHGRRSDYRICYTQSGSSPDSFLFDLSTLDLKPASAPVALDVDDTALGGDITGSFSGKLASAR